MSHSLSIVNLLLFSLIIGSCQQATKPSAKAEKMANQLINPTLKYKKYTPKSTDYVINRADYQDQLYGFWLGQCIANWTGLVTEMDKIGGEGKEGRAAGFYTRESWGQPDELNLWGFSDVSDTITFVFEDEGAVWGADDDTDIEYIYQHLLYENKTTQLTGTQIRDGWLTHIYTDKNTPFKARDGKTPENFLWVSNQTAFDLMQKGMVPPATSMPENNPHYEMIDAQLTTEIFGLFAPIRPEIAVEMAHLPIRTTAQENAALIAEFYVRMYALAAKVDEDQPLKQVVFEMAAAARRHIPNDSYTAKMYDFVKAQYDAGVTWEAARDALHEKYQVRQEDGYEWSTKDKSCNGCFAAGINFGAGMVSLFYGEGDIKESIKIGVLAGWDSDNPTATWGGMLGFMLGKQGVEKAFGRKFADQFNIHRTRGGFSNNGLDNFTDMSRKGVYIVDRVVQDRMDGGVDLEKNVWYIPSS